MPKSFLERYRSGEYAQVWADLLALGDRVRQEPMYSDALAVARETMTRAKINVDMLVSRLDAVSYGFQLPHDRSSSRDLAVRVPPPADVIGKVSELEQIVGLLPLSLRAWYEIVGGVCLAGQHEGWPGMVISDPLEVGDIEPVIADAQAWVRMREKRGCTRPFHVSVSPDCYQKADVSGDNYVIYLPNAAADASLEKEPHQTTFVDYLRISFAWGGFPGFSLVRDYPRGDIAALTKDLLPL